MKKILFILIIVLILSSISFGMTNQEKANALKEMGILKGTDQGLQLDEEFTRAQGAVMLVRMLGAVDKLQEKEYNHPFNDVPEWASDHVGYLYQNGLANGISSDTYGSDQEMRSNDYLTFVLRALDYDDSKGDFSWSSAGDKAEDLNIIDSERKEKYRNGTFLREDMADVTYNSLNTNMKDSNKILVDILNEKTTITNTVDVTTNTDNSISNTNNISNLNNSEVTINTDNSDNSVNNSNNTVYDYSTTVNNYIDNSITINNVSYNNLEDVLSKIRGLDTEISGDIIFNVQTETGEPIEGAILYIDDEIKGLSNEKGIIGLSDKEVLNTNYIKIRKEGYKQYFEKISFENKKEFEIKLQESLDKLASIEYSSNKEIYEAYGRVHRKENSIYLWGQFLDDNYGEIIEFKILNEDNNNIVQNWEKGNYGSHWRSSFNEYKIGYVSDYNDGYGLKNDELYTIEITRNDGQTITTKLTPVESPIVRDIEPNEISVAEETVILNYSLVNNKEYIGNIPFALVNKDGNVIYQEVKKIEKNRERLIYFELLDSDLLKEAEYLYIKPVEEDSVFITTNEIIRYEKINEPKIIFFDHSEFQKEEKSGSEELPFDFYGYNFDNQSYKAKLMTRDESFTYDLTYQSRKADDGILDILETTVNRSELPSGTYYIEFLDLYSSPTYGSFKVE